MGVGIIKCIRICIYILRAIYTKVSVVVPVIDRAIDLHLWRDEAVSVYEPLGRNFAPFVATRDAIRLCSDILLFFVVGKAWCGEINNGGGEEMLVEDVSFSFIFLCRGGAEMVIGWVCGVGCCGRVGL